MVAGCAAIFIGYKIYSFNETVGFSNGDTLPSFCYPDAGGNKICSGSFAGKIVLYQFWASWCEPCKAELPVLKQLYAGFRQFPSFRMVSISLDTDSSQWKTAIRRWDLPSPIQLCDLKGIDSPATKTLGVTEIPAFILTDETGHVLARGLDLVGVRKVLEQKLGVSR